MQQGTFYHIYNHANGSENLFKSDENYRYFLKQYSHFSNDVTETFAYCLLPNHFHILVRVKDAEVLKEVWNHKYGNSGKTLEGLQTLEELVVKQFSIFLILTHRLLIKCGEEREVCLCILSKERKLNRIITLLRLYIIYMQILFIMVC